jgi:hypothetical protein
MVLIYLENGLVHYGGKMTIIRQYYTNIPCQGWDCKFWKELNNPEEFIPMGSREHCSKTEDIDIMLKDAQGQSSKNNAIRAMFFDEYYTAFYKLMENKDFEKCPLFQKI